MSVISTFSSVRCNDFCDKTHMLCNWGLRLYIMQSDSSVMEQMSAWIWRETTQSFIHSFLSLATFLFEASRFMEQLFLSLPNHSCSTEQITANLLHASVSFFLQNWNLASLLIQNERISYFFSSPFSSSAWLKLIGISVAMIILLLFCLFLSLGGSNYQNKLARRFEETVSSELLQWKLSIVVIHIYDSLEAAQILTTDGWSNIPLNTVTRTTSELFFSHLLFPFIHHNQRE